MPKRTRCVSLHVLEAIAIRCMTNMACMQLASHSRLHVLQKQNHYEHAAPWVALPRSWHSTDRRRCTVAARCGGPCARRACWTSRSYCTPAQRHEQNPRHHMLRNLAPGPLPSYPVDPLRASVTCSSNSDGVRPSATSICMMVGSRVYKSSVRTGVSNNQSTLFSFRARRPFLLEPLLSPSQDRFFMLPSAEARPPL